MILTMIVHGKNVDERFPVLNVGSVQRPIYMPADVCRIERGQSAKSKLTPKQTQNMIEFAVRPPHLNAKSIANDSSAIVGIGNAQNPWKTGFRIQVPADLIAVPARVLPAPEIVYAQNMPAELTEASWNMKNLRVNKAGQLKSWIPIFLRTPTESQSVQQNQVPKKISLLTQSLRILGMTVDAPGPYQLRMVHEDDRLDESVDQIFREFSQGFKFILFILPVWLDTVYKRIKYFADVKYGVQCVCVLSKNVGKGHPMYWANVGLKINIKCGGMNQSMKPTKLSLLGDNKTMAVGIDVTHPQPGSSDKAPSVASMVATVDNKLGIYPCVLRVQAKRRDEMVNDLDEMLQSRLKLWLSKGNHKEYPENILVFRDGVSEGQYHLVLQHELPLLRKACDKLYPAQMQKAGLPRFFVAICSKRHNTRFYPTDINTADAGSNCKPGTVVDRGVTEPRNWEFFLQAHKCLKGTARPAHFFIVHDEVFSNKAVVAKLNKPGYSVADVVEEMCHQMAYLYPRATKAVSLCPPAKFADMACERARAYLSSYYEPEASVTASTTSTGGPTAMDDQRGRIRVHDNVKDTMFYI